MFLTLPRIIYSPLLQLSTKVTFLHRSDYKKNLELRQYKNGFVSAKRMLVLKMPPFFPCRVVGDGKRAAISKQTCFSQKRVRSYIFLALIL